MADLIKIKLNGKEVEVEKGTTILDAVKPHGAEVPHYCYHPGLSIAGNCRMCLVRTALKNPRDPDGPAQWMPKPSIACQSIVTPGMEVDTESDKVKKLQEAIMEFLLINHPLDCPECDQAGECRLQDYSFQYGQDRSRFIEQKTTKRIKNVGPQIALWGTRCIVCTRCVRFLEEVSGGAEISVFERGDRSVVDVHPGKEVDNPLAGNIVDICPVGALVSRDFLYKARVWFMQSEKSICNMCSKGCNINVDSLEGNIKRLTPRENLAVNQYWMCDYGRFGWKYIYSDDRLIAPLQNGQAIKWSESFDIARDLFSKAKGTGFGALISLFATNEELYLLDQLARKTLGIEAIALLENTVKHDEVFPKFKINGDKQPNRRGFSQIMGKANTYEQLLDQIESKKIQNLIIFGGIPDYKYNPAFVAAAKKLKTLIVFDLMRSDLADAAHLTFPMLAFAEKAGSYVNADGIVQRFDKAVEAQFPAEEEVNILQKLIRIQNSSYKVLTVGGVFSKLAKEYKAFEEMSYKTLEYKGQKAQA